MPQSQSMPMDNREPIQSGKISTRRAEAGKVGMFEVPRWVDVAWLPSGRMTKTGFSMICTLRMAAQSFIEMKCPVVPVSAFAMTLLQVFCNREVDGVVKRFRICFGLELKTLANLAELLWLLCWAFLYLLL